MKKEGRIWGSGRGGGGEGDCFTRERRQGHDTSDEKTKLQAKNTHFYFILS